MPHIAWFRLYEVSKIGKFTGKEIVLVVAKDGGKKIVKKKKLKKKKRKSWLFWGREFLF